MKVNSTGLGKTTLVADFGQLTTVNDATPGFKMTIEATQPIHWHITVVLDGSDIRGFIKMLLKPAILWHAIKVLFSRAPATVPAPQTKPAPSKPAVTTADAKPPLKAETKPASASAEKKPVTGA